MVAYFKDNYISKVDVFGNGESIFHAVDDEKNELTGVNRTLSSTLTIEFQDNKPKRINFYKQADASFIPPHELTPEAQKLKGFTWKEDIRPTKDEVLPESFKPRAQIIKAPQNREEVISKKEINPEISNPAYCRRARHHAHGGCECRADLPAARSQPDLR